MASIGHLATGALIGAVYSRVTDTKPLPAMAAFAGLAVAPDLDLLAIPFNPKGTPLEHRVISHALPFAAVMSLVIALALGKRPYRLLLAATSFLAMASHGVLDGFTRHGSGPALWWPFSDARYAFSWQPLRGSESFEGYFTWQGIPTVLTEAVMFLPVMALTVLIIARRGRSLGLGNTAEMAAASESS
jgi:inner membrane protein